MTISPTARRIRIIGARPSGIPPELYLPHQPAAFDAECGTYRAADYDGQSSESGGSTAFRSGSDSRMLIHPGRG